MPSSSDWEGAAQGIRSPCSDRLFYDDESRPCDKLVLPSSCDCWCDLNLLYNPLHFNMLVNSRNPISEAKLNFPRFPTARARPVAVVLGTVLVVGGRVVIPARGTKIGGESGQHWEASRNSQISQPHLSATVVVAFPFCLCAGNPDGSYEYRE